MARPALGRHRDGREPPQDRGAAARTRRRRRRRAGGRSITRRPAAPTFRSSIPPSRSAREGRVVAIGRDLRSIAALQQRLVEAQQSMERDYWRLRHVETRYRLLFQMATEAVLIVDAATPARSSRPILPRMRCSASPRAAMVGRTFLDAFDGDSATAIDALLAGVRVAGRADDVRARLASGDRAVPRVGVAVPPGERVAVPGAPVAAARATRRRRGVRAVDARRCWPGGGARPTPSSSPIPTAACSRPTPRSSTSRSSRPRSRRAASRSTAGSAGPASTSTC